MKMQGNVRKGIAILLAAILTIAVTACAPAVAQTPTPGGPTATPTPPPNINLVLWVTSGSIIGGAETSLTQDQWVLTNELKVFEAAHPGVTVDVEVEADVLQAHQLFKTAVASGTAPDVANLWSGLYTAQMKDVAYILDGKVPQADLDGLLGWDTVTSGGSILAYPWGSVGAIGIGYNKAIIAQAGLDFENNPPKTSAEFNAACEKIKALGIIPLVSDEGSGLQNLYFFAESWWQSISGAATIAKENTGELKFANDAGLNSALDYYASLFKNGYVNQDALSSSNKNERFFTGKAAMRYCGDGSIPTLYAALGDNLGVIQTPDLPGVLTPGGQIGGSGGSLVIAKTTKNPEMAIQLCSFLNSAEFYKAFVKVNPMICLRKDFTFADSGMATPGMPAAEVALYQKIVSWMPKSLLYTDNLVDPDAMAELAKDAPLVYTGQMTPQQAAEAMDKQIALKI